MRRTKHSPGDPDTPDGLKRDLGLFMAALVAALTAIVINAVPATDLPGPFGIVSEYPFLFMVILLAAGVALTRLQRAATRTPTQNSPTSTERQERRLLGFLRKQWFDPVLRDAWPDLKPVGVGLLYRSVKVAQITGAREVELTSVRDAWRRSPEGFLIVGGVGSGKTRQLVLLARSIAEDVNRGPGGPLPLILTLSSYRRGRTFRSWLEEEAWRTARVDATSLERWLTEEKLVLLLDDIDELSVENLTALLSNLRVFIAERSGCPVVLTCGLSAHPDLLEILPHRVTIMAPTPSLLVSHASGLGDAYAGFREVLEMSKPLRDATANLLLFNVACVVYRGRSADEILTDLDISSGQGHLLEAYLRRVYVKGAARPNPVNEADSRHFLRWLARQMRASGDTLYLPDWIPLTALSASRRKRLVQYGIPAAAGLVICILGVALTLMLVALARVLNFGPAITTQVAITVALQLNVALGVAAAHRLLRQPIAPVRDLQWTSRFTTTDWRVVVGIASLTGLCVGIGSFLLLSPHYGFSAFRVSLAQALASSALASGAAIILRGLDNAVNEAPDAPLAGLESSLKSAAGAGLAYAVSGFLVGGLVFGPASALTLGLALQLPTATLAVEVFGVLVAVATALGLILAVATFGVYMALVAQAPAPGTRRLSLRQVVPTSLLYGAIIVLTATIALTPTGGIAIGLAQGPSGAFFEPLALGQPGGMGGALFGALAFAAPCSLAGWFTYGGGTTLRFKALVAQLRSEGHFARSVVEHLEEAEDLGVLQRVGGGYRFLHGQLATHFAGEEP